MAATNVSQFVSAVGAFNRTIEGAVISVHKKLSLEGLRRLVNRTPVDTGRARGNWQLAVNQDVRGVADFAAGDQGDIEANGRRAANTAISAGLRNLSGLPAFARVVIGNNLPYIRRLEDGYSPQTPPGGMLELTFNELQTFAASNRGALQLEGGGSFGNNITP